MGQAGLLDFALDLIRQAETACAETDTGMQEVAGMVYVGDVYALLVTRASGGPPAAGAAASRDGVWPFIR